MTRLWRWVSLCLVVLVAGCVTDGTTYRNPLLQTTSTTAPALQLVFSPQAHANIQKLTDKANSEASWGATQFAAQINPQYVVDALTRALTTRFGSVGLVSSPEAAAGGLMAVVDFDYDIGMVSFGTTTVSLTLRFVGADGRAIETIPVTGAAQVPFPVGGPHFPPAVDQAVSRLNQRVSASAALTQVASQQRPVARQAPNVPRPAAPTTGQGLYALEGEITFNVLDNVVYDAATGRLTLLGHRDERYKTSPIPYLQHLATLLEHPRPEFSLDWTPESERRVDAFLARAFSPSEVQRVTAQWGQIFEPSGAVSANGRRLLPMLGVSPSQSGGPAGYLGVTTAEHPEGVLVQAVARGSPADQAGVRVGDMIFSLGQAWPIHPLELARLMRLWGAGHSFNLIVWRAGRQLELPVTLAAAPGDPWAGMSRNQVAAAIFRAAGNPEAGRLTSFIEIYDQLQNTAAKGLAFQRFIAILNLEDFLENTRVRSQRGEISRVAAEHQLARAIADAEDRTYRFAGAPVLRRFDAVYAQTGDWYAALDAANGEVDRLRPAAMAEALDTLWARPEGIPIPAEMIDAAFGVRPEVTPRYINVDARSQLARVMFEADYVGKKLISAPDLTARIARYETAFAFNRRRAIRTRAEATEHMWISIARLDVGQSRDGSTLATRNAAMRFNIRTIGADGRDLPPIPGGYEELLTSLYDDLAVEFPVLHELRETAKLTAVAEWLRARRIDVRLPAAGRTAWQGPSVAPGFVYMYLYPPSGNSRVDTTVLATGGVSLVPFERGVARDLVVIDSSVVDLRDRVAGGASLGDPALLQKVGGTPVKSLGSASGTSLGFTMDADLRDAPRDLRFRKRGSALTAWNPQSLATAAQNLRNLLASAPDDPVRNSAIHMLLAENLIELGDIEGARRELMVSARLTPDEPQLRLIYARAMDAAGERPRAIAALREYVGLAPFNNEANRLLAELTAGGLPTSGPSPFGTVPEQLGVVRQGVTPVTPSPSATRPPTAPPVQAVSAISAVPVGSCSLIDPTKAGCLEVRNTLDQRVRAYVHELPGVFCTIEPGSMCSLPVATGVYHGYAELDDGRRTSISTITLEPQGARWTIATSTAR